MSRSVGGIYDALMDVVSRFYAIVDYPDEEIEPLQQAQIEQTLAESAERLDALLATFSRGRLLKSGVPAVILGKPNAGKSSLLNALLGYDRAIVTDIAGTTRDTVEEKVLVGSVLLRLCDTAGIRDAADTVERLGVERAQQAAQRAELALLVLDGSAPLTREDEEAIAAARRGAADARTREQGGSAAGAGHGGAAGTLRRGDPLSARAAARAWTRCAARWRSSLPGRDAARRAF